jgi:hypothetical protein
MLNKIPQISQSFTLCEGSHQENYKLSKMFDIFCNDRKETYGDFFTYEIKNVGNGKEFLIYFDNILIEEISHLSDRYGSSIENTFYH